MFFMEKIKIKNVMPQLNLGLVVEFDTRVNKAYDVSTLFDLFPEYRIIAKS